MKTALFYCTNRPGGLDVLHGNFDRQKEQPDLLIVCDELNRTSHFNTIGGYYTDEVINIEPPVIKEGEIRNLARASNLAAKIALEKKCDLLILLQDYIWIPDYGIHRMKKLVEAEGDNKLYTGLCSISKDPEETVIGEMAGTAYSIFERPYFDKPQVIQWDDIRQEMYRKMFERGDYIVTVDPNHFEANWGAVPVDLFKRGLRWDEDFDKGVALENNDLARQVIECYGGAVVVDSGNHAISLPHRDYFHGEAEFIVQHNNRGRYEQKWSS